MPRDDDLPIERLQVGSRLFLARRTDISLLRVFSAGIVCLPTLCARVYKFGLRFCLLLVSAPKLVRTMAAAAAAAESTATSGAATSCSDSPSYSARVSADCSLLLLVPILFCSLCERNLTSPFSSGFLRVLTSTRVKVAAAAAAESTATSGAATSCSDSPSYSARVSADCSLLLLVPILFCSLCERNLTSPFSSGFLRVLTSTRVKVAAAAQVLGRRRRRRVCCCRRRSFARRAKSERVCHSVSLSRGAQLNPLARRARHTHTHTQTRFNRAPLLLVSALPAPAR